MLVTHRDKTGALAWRTPGGTNDNWEVLVKGAMVGELESVNFDEL